jgi:HSP90 family molecular chaperone
VLEINLDHPIVKNLNTLYEKDPESADAKERIDLVFNTAALAGGYVLANAAEYSKLVVNMMTKATL